MTTRRIVVTGLGAVTPVGNDVAAYWDALRAARSGAARIRGFETDAFRPDYAAEVKEFAPERAGLQRKKLKMMGRHAQLALVAATEAARDAGLCDTGGHPAPARIGIIFGVGMLNADERDLGRALAAARAICAGNGGGHFPATERIDMTTFGRACVSEMAPLWLLRHIPNLVTAHATIMLDARAASNTIMNGCVASASAIGEAARVIARGDADIMFTGGADARVSPLALLRYRGLGWLSERDTDEPWTVSAPFDSGASGFVTGEAAGVLVLEDKAHAAARGARMYAELAGFGAANDAYHPLHPHPDGCGLSCAITRCLKATTGRVSDGFAVFAPATGVPEFDRAGARALSAVFQGRGVRPLVTATRSIVGHTHAASSALDCIAAMKSLGEAQVPGTINLRDPIADFNYAGPAPQPFDPEAALVAAYGFGGQAAAITWRGCSA